MVVRLTEPYGSVVRPNLTEPPSSAEPDPDPERFGRSLKLSNLSSLSVVSLCSFIIHVLFVTLDNEIQ